MKKSLIAASLALGLFGASCLGPNKAFNSVHDWNMKVSDNRWVNEAVFLGMNIIPVYGVCLFADYIVLNSIEWWTGSNPVK
jgi:hypothetical protein